MIGAIILLAIIWVIVGAVSHSALIGFAAAAGYFVLRLLVGWRRVQQLRKKAPDQLS